MENGSLAAQAVAAGPMTAAPPSFLGMEWLLAINLAAATLALLVLSFAARRVWDAWRSTPDRTNSAAELMQRMQASHIQMALVIDEYGGTDGLVSLEDILEMVVGDIEDEHDDEEVLVTHAGEGVYYADARADLEEIRKVVGPDFDVRRYEDEADTIGGLVAHAHGGLPDVGAVIEAVPGFEIEVLDADPRRVKRLRIVRFPEGPAPDLAQ